MANTGKRNPVGSPGSSSILGAFELLDSKWAQVGMERFYMLLHTFSGLLRQGIDLLFYLFSDQNPVGH